MPVKILTAAALTQLTPAEKRVAGALVTGVSHVQGAGNLDMSSNTFASHLSSIGRKFHITSRTGRPARAHAVLAGGQAVPPPAPSEAPEFSPEERRLLRALAEHLDTHDLARAAFIAPPEVRPQTRDLVAKAGANNATHLVGLGHAWGLLGADAIGSGTAEDTADERGHCGRARRSGTVTGTRTRAQHQPPLDAPSSRTEQDVPGGAADVASPPYEMCPLLTEQDRDAVAELIEQRTRWLTDRWLLPPYPGDAATLYREQWRDAVALFEDGHAVGCLRLNRRPALPYWDGESDEPSLLVSLAYTAPGRKFDLVGRLMTLWAQDFAGRLGLAWVRCEVPSGAPSRDGSLRLRLLDHLRTGCGWQFVRTHKDGGGRPIALLQLPAKARPGLEPLIRCAVPLHPAASHLAEETSR